MYHRPLVCVYNRSLFSRYMDLVGFTAHPYQNYPELSLPPLEEKDGVLKKRRFFGIKWGLEIYFSLKRDNLIWCGRRKNGIYRATYKYWLYIFKRVPPPGLIGYTLVDEKFSICSFVSPPHTSNGFQTDTKLSLLAAAGVSS